MAMLGSLRLYARHRKEVGLTGGTLAAVQKAIKSGRIRTVDEKIDFDQADRDWESNSDHRLRRKKKRVESSAAQPVMDVAPGETFLEAQRRHEWLKVQKEEMELRRRRGELVERADTEQIWSSIVIGTQSRLLILPDKIAPKVLRAKDVYECRAIIEREIREALTSLSEFQPNAA